MYLGKVPVRFEEPVYFVKERTNQTVNITVVTDLDHSFGFTVWIHTADITASGKPHPQLLSPEGCISCECPSFADGEDYGVGTFTVEFPPGVNSMTVLVIVNDDDTVEGNETFTASLAIPSAASAAGVVTMAPNVTMVTIQDEDSGWFNHTHNSYITFLSNCLFPTFHPNLKTLLYHTTEQST